MNVALFGATGFVGGRLLDALLQRGDSVTALVRTPDAAGALRARGVDALVGELLDPETVARTCRGAELVVNTAGALGRWNTPVGEMEAVNSRAPGLVVASAFGRVVHVGTVGVTGPLPDGVDAAEEYPLQPATDYQLTKLKGEASAREAHYRTGVPLTIVRPSFVYGPRDMHKLPLFRAVAKRRIALVNGGRSRLHPVYVDDLVSGILLAAELSPGDGRAYNICGPRPVTVRELIGAISTALGLPTTRLSVPETLLLPLACAVETACSLAGKEPPITRSKVRLLSENYAYSTERARRELGYLPAVDLEEGIARTVDYYRRHQLLGGMPDAG